MFTNNLKYIHSNLEDSRYNLAFANLVAEMGPKPKKSLDNSLNTSLEEMDSETTVEEQASLQGFLYKDTRSGKMILVDGILGSMFYAFDRVADKTCVLDTLSRQFSLEQMKN